MPIARGSLTSTTSVKRILLIDDDRELVDLVKDGLEYGGYEVGTAYDGESGLELAGDLQPQLILLDLQLRRMNGVEFLHKLSERGLRIPVVVITAYWHSPLATQARQMGVQQILHKPLQMDKLEKAVAELIKN